MDLRKIAWIAKIGRSGLRGVLGSAGTTIALFLGLEQLFGIIVRSDGQDAVLWAATTTIFIVIVGILIVFCSLNYNILNDEISRMANHSERLEKQILSNRQSSKKRS